MAALNIAHEYLQCTTGEGAAGSGANSKLQDMAEKLELALDRYRSVL
jgi:cell division protein ZapA (FtsZ GTPase activity inhibitor)